MSHGGLPTGPLFRMLVCFGSIYAVEAHRPGSTGEPLGRVGVPALDVESLFGKDLAGLDLTVRRSTARHEHASHQKARGDKRRTPASAGRHRRKDWSVEKHRLVVWIPQDVRDRHYKESGTS